MKIEANSRLGSLIDSVDSYKINSVHHQGIKDLAPGFVVEARCPDDGVIEAIRSTGGVSGNDWVAAVQWHPEFHRRTDDVLDDTPILQDFLAAALEARVRVSTAKNT